MNSKFGQDENGAFKRLDGGRVLRVNRRLFNTLLTISNSEQALDWRDGW